MSDLFKDHKPELSEEEDRLLWQRVRAIPALETAPALRPVPWWRRLWTMPAVRYGAPALAVLLAAVVWVINGEQVYKSERPRLVDDAPTVAREEAPAPAPILPPAASAPTTQTAPMQEEAPRVVARDRPEERSNLATIRAQDEAAGAAARSDAAGPAAPQESEAIVGQSAPTTTSLKKSAPSAAPASPQTFATPPPAAESRERKVAAESAPGAVDSRAAAKPQWGSVKNGYRDSGNAARLEMQQMLSVADQLIEGELPDPSALAAHPVVQAASPTAYGKARSVPLPMDIATQDDRRLYQVASPKYEDFAPAEQAAAIAYAFERALANPAQTPRARVERMLAYARAIEDRSGKAEKPGATRLVAMIEGALKAWP